MRVLKVWAGKTIILFLGLVPVSCHYHLTGPALWAHQSSYAFEAWLVMWIGALGLAVGTIYVCVADE